MLRHKEGSARLRNDLHRLFVVVDLLDQREKPLPGITRRQRHSIPLDSYHNMVPAYVGTKQAVAFAARMANVTEGEIIRRLVGASAQATVERDSADQGVAIYADYEGHRVRARYFRPA